jgi:hypothetical protein
MYKTLFIASLLVIQTASASNFYITGDLGYSIGFYGQHKMSVGSTALDDNDNIFIVRDSWRSLNNYESFDLDRQPKGLLTNINLGYKVNCCIRIELGLDYNPTFSSTAYFFDFEHKEIGGHATFIRDFNSTGSFTPFLFTSLGYMRATSTVKPTIKGRSEQLRGWFPSNTIFTLQRTNAGVPNGIDLSSISLGGQNILSYKIGVGGNVKMNDRLALQIKYSLGMREGFTRFKNITAVHNIQLWYSTKDEIVKNQFDHSLTMGVKMTF